ncbi:MAG: pirin family protein [Chitinophagaceae bacterium]
MKSIIYPASARGHVDIGWLNARHSFSFGQWHDAEKMHFGALRVLNDDIVRGGGGFPTHPHDNMEIVTIPLTGALAHKDSTGGNGIIKAGDVQVMSAGTGVRHSEFNASQTDEVNLLQLWVFPKKRNISPRYDQRSFDITGRTNKWQTVISPDETEGGMWINQDARFSLLHLDAGKEITYTTKFAGNGVYLFVIKGAVTIAGSDLAKRDAIGVSETAGALIKATNDTQLLAVEVPMAL